MARHRQHHISGWPAVLLAPLVLPLIVGVLILQKLSLLKSTVDLTDDDVASYIEDFLENKSGPWDWDDFISIPITDARLEAIRTEAALLNYPLDDDGYARLRKLVEDLRQPI